MRTHGNMSGRVCDVRMCGKMTLMSHKIIVLANRQSNIRLLLRNQKVDSIALKIE